jgi:hypothetical protein
MRLQSSGTFILALLLVVAAIGTTLRADEKPIAPLFTTIILKPGETQNVILSVDGLRIGAGDRTSYGVDFVNETGKPVDGPKGIKGTVDRDRMGKLFDQHKQRFIVLTIATDAGAEPGARLMRVRAEPFGGKVNYEATVQVVVGK